MKVDRGTKVVYTLRGSNVIQVADLDTAVNDLREPTCWVLGAMQCEFSTVLGHGTVIRVAEEHVDDVFFQLLGPTSLWYPFNSTRGYDLSEIITDRCEVEIAYSPDL